MYLLRRPILALSASDAVRDVLVAAPFTSSVVRRFIAGETGDDAVHAVGELTAAGLLVTLDHLGEDTVDPAAASATVEAYLTLLAQLTAAGLAAGAEVSVKLSAVGLALPAAPGQPAGRDRAAAGARRIADAAYAAGARMTLDMEDHTTVDDTLEVLAGLRADHPDVGVAMQAMLRRTASDLAGLTGPGSRVRLVKGAYDEPAPDAYDTAEQVDLAYVRGLKVLMAGRGYPMVGSHDPRLIAIARRLAADQHRSRDSYEHQMLFGIRPDEQRRLVADGYRVRVYVPYGVDWYGYFTRRLAERPANLAFFLRAVATRG
jgi:proline dehydrogenase